MEVSPKVRERLESLVARTDAESMSEVIRRALAVYDLLVSQAEVGGVVFVRGNDGSDCQVMIY